MYICHCRCLRCAGTAGAPTEIVFLPLWQIVTLPSATTVVVVAADVVVVAATVVVVGAAVVVVGAAVVVVGAAVVVVGAAVVVVGAAVVVVGTAVVVVGPAKTPAAHRATIPAMPTPNRLRANTVIARENLRSDMRLPLQENGTHPQLPENSRTTGLALSRIRAPRQLAPLPLEGG